MEQPRSFIQLLGVTLRGIAMGAADVVPGVSGGTIAFITGIYEELINSLGNINWTAFKKIKTEGLSSFWKYINGNFFVALFLGIGISILSLARIVIYLMENHPVLLWAFFFGLVLGSAQLILKTVKKWNVAVWLALLVGIAIAGYISSIHTVGTGGSSWYLVLSGALAICAMILPGISGAFILVLLGSYSLVINGLKEADFKLIGLFSLGCLIGILAFSKFLKFLFKHYKNIVLALLSGFLIGSLWKMWPWQNYLGNEPIIVHSDGREEWMKTNVWPSDYSLSENHIIGAIILAVIGFALVYFMERIGSKNKAE